MIRPLLKITTTSVATNDIVLIINKRSWTSKERRCCTLAPPWPPTQTITTTTTTTFRHWPSRQRADANRQDCKHWCHFQIWLPNISAHTLVSPFKTWVKKVRKDRKKQVRQVHLKSVCWRSSCIKISQSVDVSHITLHSQADTMAHSLLSLALISLLSVVTGNSTLTSSPLVSLPSPPKGHFLPLLLPLSSGLLSTTTTTSTTPNSILITTTDKEYLTTLISSNSTTNQLTSPSSTSQTQNSTQTPTTSSLPPSTSTLETLPQPQPQTKAQRKLFKWNSVSSGQQNERKSTFYLF